MIQLRYGLVDGQIRTLKQIGAEIGMSKTTAWRDEQSALGKMRSPTNRRLLKGYLE